MLALFSRLQLHFAGLALLFSTPRGYCLRKVEATDLQPVIYNGREYSFPVAVPVWASARPLGEILRIILEEELSIRTVLHPMRTSGATIRNILGCTDSAGELWNESGTLEEQVQARCTNSKLFQDPPVRAWAALSIWEPAVSPELFRMTANAGYLHPLGYRTTTGLYTHGDIVQAAANSSGLLLKWWEAYGVGRGARGFFDGVVAVDAAIRGMSNFSQAVCPSGDCPPGTIRPLCDLSDPAVRQEAEEMLESGMRCDGGWWYSPACDQDRDACIPVIMAEYSWNVRSWCAAIRSKNLPFAVTWLGWSRERDVVRSMSTLRFLFYWWQPEPAFVNMEPTPQQIYFSEGEDMPLQGTNPVVAVWGGVRDVDAAAYHVLQMISVDDGDLQQMMLDMAAGMGDADLACNWLRRPMNEAKWRQWLPEPVNVTMTPEEMEQQAIMHGLTIAGASVLGLAVLSVLCWALWYWCRRLRSNKPSNPSSVVGGEVFRWIGPHAQRSLVQTDANDIKGRFKAWYVNATPFHVSVRGSLFSIDMDPTSFCHGLSRNVQGSFEIIAGPTKADEDWQTLAESVRLRFEPSDFSTRPTDVDCGGADPVTYRSPVARKVLPDGPAGPMGQLKVVRLRGVFLVMWSPPHISRGIPLTEFQEFLTSVVEHPGTWENCEAISIDGERSLVNKRQFSDTRNMYDANRFIVRPEATLVDASYAEARTDYGPPDMFISHVWGESAVCTRSAIEELSKWKNNFKRARSAMSNVGSAGAELRVWFCVLCNNQSRVVEELGHDVYYSPFAQVLRSPTVCEVALVSPFRALNRKWCNYEFCLSGHESKSVLMLTKEGVVQAGHVPPVILRDLALKVATFNCEDATCSNSADSDLIDRAVKQMGGYDKLTESLQGVFREAIAKAHMCLKQAVRHMRKLEVGDGIVADDTAGDEGEWSPLSIRTL
mmetsp:Transcript_68167/g.197619  ORF Transcript_68167/g.197619 Transcript_68167/m.197619 type:complete len:937 (-) Transcript_68167:128-2938(-)